jgi:5-methylcytosine-specific restriction endonuclease McrA
MPRQQWIKDPNGPKRLSGRTLQTRNDRIKARDKWTCQGCGRITDQLDVDHKVPLSQGGSEADDNLQCLCRGQAGCHEAKSRIERGERDRVAFGADGWPVA